MAAFLQVVSLNTSIPNVVPDKWCMVQSATHQMTGRADLFTKLLSLKKKVSIPVGNGKAIHAVAWIVINIPLYNGRNWVEKHFENVYFIPEMKYNLYAVRSTLDQCFELSVLKSYCLIMKDEHTVAVGVREGNLCTTKLKM